MEEKVYFENSDGLRLCGIFSEPNNKTRKCIVLCHGIGNVDKDEDGIFVQLSQALAIMGFGVFRFDFRGQGESEGKQIDMTITGEKRDLESAVNFLKEKGYIYFGILGASFAGGAVSLYARENSNIVKALVLWNALIDYSSIINPVTKWGKKYWGRPAFDRAEQFGFTEIGTSKYKAGKKLMDEIKILKPFEELISLDLPILFVHGDRDTYIPYSDSVKYSSLMKNAKLETIHGAEHGFNGNPKDAKKVNEVTIKFFQEYL